MSRILRRRNRVCRDRDCNCYCHWDLKGFSHCHFDRKCRDVECTCANPITLHEITPPLHDLFPEVSVRRGGIKYPSPVGLTWGRGAKEVTNERKHDMYEVRVVIEEEGRPLVDVSITTTRPREGINAAAKAADDAMKAHPDGPEEQES
jgi:hypothetical protein